MHSTQRNLIVLGLILSSLCLIVYVSIPDFPRTAKPWELMLWGESSQWWSEVSWIILFDVFSISILFVWGFSDQLKERSIDSTLYYVRVVFSIVFLLLLFDFSILYFEWSGWMGTVVLDRGGWLHGAFYLGVALEGMYLFSEALGLGCKIHRLVLSRIGQSS